MHIPVLFEETVDALAVKAGGTYVDGTLGRAGHASEVLRRAGPEGRLLGIDRDGEALARATKVLDPIPGHKVLAHGEHGDLAAIATANGFDAVDGILLDLGVSSDQLDTPERGFSFMREGPLDMRMDRSRGRSAADLVNEEDAERLEEIFREWGEEPQARRIAKAIAAERAKKPFETTTELAEFVEKTLGRRGGKHPATRVFQALRMEVNGEMDELMRALEGGMEILRSGGRFAVITFESLTDRAVKRFFASHVGRMVSLQQGGERWEGVEPRARAVAKRAVIASEEEQNNNPRSRSAKLRAVEKE